MVEVKRKVALVTGAGRRMGRAMALHLSVQGWCIAAHYNKSRESVDDLVTEIRRNGGRAAALQADLEKEGQIEDLLPRSCDELGRVSLLINNAGCFERDSIESANRASWNRHMQPNLHAPLILSQAFAAQFRGEGSGCIVNIIDQHISNQTPHYLSYTLSRAGLWTLTRTLAMALGPQIRVNGIGPGPTLREAAGQDETEATHTPLKCSATLDDICRCLDFILATPCLTGQMIALDGGEHLGCSPVMAFDPVE